MKKIIVGMSVIIFSLSTTSITFAAVDTDGVNLSATIGESMTLACGADVDIDGGGSVTAGTPESNSTTCTVTTNDNDGYNLQIADDNAGSDALVNGSNTITDKTAWDPTAAAGNGNAVAWSGTGLGFSVYASTATKNTTWWGTGSACHDANNKYAGLPDSATNIMEHTAYSSSSTTTSICYRVDVPATQASGEYSGSVTYTATGRP